jgi:hypothetical protein
MWAVEHGRLGRTRLGGVNFAWGACQQRTELGTSTVARFRVEGLAFDPGK